MKTKHLLFAFTCLVINTSVHAQTQRTVFVEQFTQASCGPCASQNPAFNILLANNSTTNKVISLKYQTSWPGVDPMNAQNASEVATRVSYYGVSGVPEALIDGVNGPGTAPYVGAPAAVTQTHLNNRYAITSPISLTVVHSYNATYDSVTVKAVYENLDSVAINTVKLHMAITEKEIVFNTPPGSNGELDFYNVMRKMYPNAGGTTISLAAGAKDSMTIKVKIPSYIYDLSEIQFVSFIQNDVSKDVMQAAKSPILPLPYDAKGILVSGIPTSPSCDSIYNIDFTIKNVGANTITNATIQYKISPGGTLQSLPFTGNLTVGNTTIITIPNVNVGIGSKVISLYVKQPNGNTDFNAKNDSTIAAYGTFAAPTTITIPLAYNENFGTVFPPSNWIVQDGTGDNLGWMRATAGSTGANTYSARMNFYNSPAGNEDYLHVKTISLAGLTNASIGFKVAHAPYTAGAGAENDRIDLEYSTDCGTTWTSIWNKSGTTLATSAATTTSFAPTTAAQWRQELVTINNLAGQSKVHFRFKGTSEYGNNSYVDNVNIYSSGVNSLNNIINDAVISIYPNPATEELSINTENINLTSITFIDNVGRTVKEINTTQKENKIAISDLATGIYTVKLASPVGIAIQKFIKQ